MVYPHRYHIHPTMQRQLLLSAAIALSNVASVAGQAAATTSNSLNNCISRNLVRFIDIIIQLSYTNTTSSSSGLAFNQRGSGSPRSEFRGEDWHHRWLRRCSYTPPRYPWSPLLLSDQTSPQAQAKRHPSP